MRKKRKELLFILSIFFIVGATLSCSNNAEKPADGNSTQSTDTIPAKVSARYKTSSAHQISLQEAVSYIANFLQKGKLYTAQKNNGIGGTIGYGSWYSLNLSTNVEKFNASIPVVNFFPCLKSSGIYLGITKDVVLDSTKCGCDMNDNAVILTTSGVLKYKSPDVAEEDVLNYLMQMEELMPTSYGTALKSDVEKHSGDFLDAYSLNDGRLNQSLCGYFEEKDLNILKHQVDPVNGEFDCDAFRFFMGYDPGAKDNKLRLILIGVKVDPVTHKGKNILQYADLSDAFMMEKAWPPDNCQIKNTEQKPTEKK